LMAWTLMEIPLGTEDGANDTQHYPRRLGR